MQDGIAIEQTWTAGVPDFIGDNDPRCQTMNIGGTGKLIPCDKCPECGFSITKGVAMTHHSPSIYSRYERVIMELTEWICELTWGGHEKQCKSFAGGAGPCSCIAMWIKEGHDAMRLREIEMVQRPPNGDSTPPTMPNLVPRMMELQAENDMLKHENRKLRHMVHNDPVASVCSALGSKVADLESMNEDYRREIEQCFDLAQLADAMNPDVPGAFTGTPSERLSRAFMRFMS